MAGPETSLSASSQTYLQDEFESSNSYIGSPSLFDGEDTAPNGNTFDVLKTHDCVVKLDIDENPPLDFIDPSLLSNIWDDLELSSTEDEDRTQSNLITTVPASEFINTAQSDALNDELWASLDVEMANNPFSFDSLLTSIDLPPTIQAGPPVLLQDTSVNSSPSQQPTASPARLSHRDGHMIDATTQTSPPVSASTSPLQPSSPVSPSASIQRSYRRKPFTKTYFCPVVTCSRSRSGKGFTNGRRDNMVQHVKACHRDEMSQEDWKAFSEGVGAVGRGRPRKM